MLANNNQSVIRRMAKRSLVSNKRRTIIMALAVALSAFMLFSVFTVGITYFKMYRLQNIRLSGGDFDAIMYGMTEEQKKKCEEKMCIRDSIRPAENFYIRWASWCGAWVFCL